MRPSLIVIVSALLLGIAIGRLWPESVANAGAADCGAGAVNGNVNGDDSRDISDVIFLLNHLFAGGAPPCDNRADLERELARCREELDRCRRELEECRGQGDLVWYSTCGDPVCGGYRGPFPDVPLCTDEREGSPCEEPGALCDLEDDCNRMLVCAREDPKLAGCPISKRERKREIEYLDRSGLDAAREELLRLRIATWRYRTDAVDRSPRLGFIIDDAPESPAVRPDGERVDLYGYTSLAVAAIQSQAEQLARLESELAGLRRKLETVMGRGVGSE